MSRMKQLFSISSPIYMLGSITSRDAYDQKSCFEDTPGLFMFAMLYVRISTGTALLAATTLAVIPVSTTQTVLGAIVASTLTFKLQGLQLCRVVQVTHSRGSTTGWR